MGWPARVGKIVLPAALPRHADLVVADAARGVGSLADLADLRGRDAAFERVVRGKPAAMGGGRTP